MAFERPLPLGAALVQFRTQRQLPQTCCGRLFVDELADRFAAFLAGRGQRGLHFAQRVRFARRLQMHPRPRLVEHVDGLVGEEAVGDIAVRERHARFERLVRVADFVVRLVAGRDVAQNLERLLARSRFDQHALEAAFERRVLLDVLAVLVERRGADGLQLAARKRRFEDIGRVETSLSRPRADDGVDLVDEDDRVVGLAQLVEQLLHPLLEFAAELRASHQRRDVERIEPLARDGVGNVARCDQQREPLDDVALAHARFADQDRIVFLAARKDLHHALDLAFAADHGVDFPFTRLPGQVYAELVEHPAAFGGPLSLLGVVEQADVQLGARFVGRAHAADFVLDDGRRDVVHFQYVRADRLLVADDGM